MSDAGFVLQVSYQHSYAVSAVSSLVLSSAVNYAQTHQSQTCHLHSESTQCGISFHYLKLPLSSMEDEWEVCYFIFPTSACMYTFILSVLPGNCFCDCSLGSPCNQQRPVTVFLAAALFCTACLLSQGTKLVSFWCDAFFLCSTERTIRLLLNLGFPCWLMKKHFHEFFISFTAIKGWSLELFSLYFFFLFCQVKLHLRITMLICFRWRLFYVYKTWTHRSVWTDHPCEYLY